MKELSDFLYPIPKNHQDFERLVRDLWKKKLNTEDVQLNGRSGQGQNGVDIFSQNDKQEWIGIQCKEKFFGKILTEKEIIKEVNDAKSFDPKLTHYIIATTTPRDANSQKTVRILNDENKKNGLFNITITSWEEICDELVTYKDLAIKHLPFPAMVSKKIGNCDSIMLELYIFMEDKFNGSRFELILSKPPKEDEYYNQSIIISDLTNRKCISYRFVKNKHWSRLDDIYHNLFNSFALTKWLCSFETIDDIFSITGRDHIYGLSDTDLEEFDNLCISTNKDHD